MGTQEMNWGETMAAAVDARGQEDYARAEDLLRTALLDAGDAKVPESRLGLTLLRLAELCDFQDRCEEAERLYLQSLAAFEQAFGGEHPYVLSVLHYLQTFYESLERHDDAHALERRLEAALASLYAPGDERLVVVTMVGRGNQRGRHFNQLIHFIPGREILERHRLSPDWASPMSLLAQYYHRRGCFSLAEDAYRRAMLEYRIALAPDHPGQVANLRHFAQLLRTIGKADEAATLEGRIEAIRAAQDAEATVLAGSDPEERARCFHRRGMGMEGIRNWEGAVKAYAEGLAMEPQDPTVRYFLHNNLGYSLNMLMRHQEAEAQCREAIRVDPLRGNAYKNLGLALRGLARHADAARVLVESVRVTKGHDPRGALILEDMINMHPELTLELPDIAARLEECKAWCREAKTMFDAPK